MHHLHGRHDTGRHHRHDHHLLAASPGGRPSGRSGRHGFGSGNGGGRGPRQFEQGGLKLLALSLVAERPCHGYEVIKAIEEMVGGEYSPSPGVIYPTLSYLADVGWATATEQEGGRKQYAITAAGRTQLDSQRAELKALQARLRATRREAGARGAPELQRAMSNLKTALQMRFAQGLPDKALIHQVADIIDQAAVAIERL